MVLIGEAVFLANDTGTRLDIEDVQIRDNDFGDHFIGIRVASGATGTVDDAVISNNNNLQVSLYPSSMFFKIETETNPVFICL